MRIGQARRLATCTHAGVLAAGVHLPDAGVLLPGHALDLLRGQCQMLVVLHLSSSQPDLTSLYHHDCRRPKRLLRLVLTPLGCMTTACLCRLQYASTGSILHTASALCLAILERRWRQQVPLHWPTLLQSCSNPHREHHRGALDCRCVHAVFEWRPWHRHAGLRKRCCMAVRRLAGCWLSPTLPKSQCIAFVTMPRHPLRQLQQCT